jgi:hypothetical protein
MFHPAFWGGTSVSFLDGSAEKEAFAIARNSLFDRSESKIHFLLDAGEAALV